MKQTIENALRKNGGVGGVLEALADSSFDSILITESTKAGKIVYANKAFKRLTGFGRQEVIGKSPRILQGPATDKKVLNRLRVALEKGTCFEGKAVNYKKDGTPFIMEWRVVPAQIDKTSKVWVAIQREAAHID
jgi:PAS domain S-box-containing protein